LWLVCDATAVKWIPFCCVTSTNLPAMGAGFPGAACPFAISEINIPTRPAAAILLKPLPLPLTKTSAARLIGPVTY
jgi:hypothetical protein